jgi:hypothetical protein
LHSTFHVGSGMKNYLDPNPGWKNVQIWIQDLKIKSAKKSKISSP